MPWENTHTIMRPEGPRERAAPPRKQSSRGLPGRTLLSSFTQGIGLWPQPWAELCRPVGPGLLVALIAASELKQEEQCLSRPGLQSIELLLGESCINHMEGLC
jgi:hypothetical protein